MPTFCPAHETPAGAECGAAAARAGPPPERGEGGWGVGVGVEGPSVPVYACLRACLGWSRLCACLRAGGVHADLCVRASERVDVCGPLFIYSLSLSLCGTAQASSRAHVSTHRSHVPPVHIPYIQTRAQMRTCVHMHTRIRKATRIYRLATLAISHTHASHTHEHTHTHTHTHPFTHTHTHIANIHTHMIHMPSHDHAYTHTYTHTHTHTYTYTHRKDTHARMLAAQVSKNRPSR